MRSVWLKEPVAAIRLLDPRIGAELVGERAETRLCRHTSVRSFEKHVALVRALADLVQAVDVPPSREDVIQLNRTHRPIAQNPDV